MKSQMEQRYEEQLLQERERVRAACLSAIGKVSRWGPRGVGRKSTEQLQDEILETVRKLDLGVPSVPAETQCNDSVQNSSRAA